MRFKDLTGKKFGDLTVISRADDYVSPSGAHNAQWNCHCSCGKSTVARGDYLKSGRISSCVHKIRFDLTGQVFGMLTVLYRTKDLHTKKGQRRVKWHCRCACGNEVDVLAYALTSGKTRSCGQHRDSVHVGRSSIE